MIGRVLFIVIAVVAFAIDRVTKLIVEADMHLGERIDIIGDVLQLHHVRNSGIAFGLLADRGSLVLAGSVIVGILLFFFLLHVHPDDYVTVIGGSLVTAGALGNLYDRVQYRYVIDFIQVPRFPTFNVADICITVGVVLIVIGQLRDMARMEERSASDTDEQAPQQSTSERHP